MSIDNDQTEDSLAPERVDYLTDDVVQRHCGNAHSSAKAGMFVGTPER
jgi:hypothetical protein